MSINQNFSRLNGNPDESEIELATPELWSCVKVEVDVLGSRP